MDLVKETQTRKYINISKQYLKDNFSIKEEGEMSALLNKVASKNGRLYQRIQQIYRYQLREDKIMLYGWD